MDSWEKLLQQGFETKIQPPSALENTQEANLASNT